MAVPPPNDSFSSPTSTRIQPYPIPPSRLLPCLLCILSALTLLHPFTSLSLPLQHLFTEKINNSPSLLSRVPFKKCTNLYLALVISYLSKILSRDALPSDLLPTTPVNHDSCKYYSRSLFPSPIFTSRYVFEFQNFQFPPPLEGTTIRERCSLPKNSFFQKLTSIFLLNLCNMNNDSSISLLNSGGASSSALVATPHILDDEFLEEESNPILLDEEPQPLLQKALSLTIAGKLISQRRPNLANITYSTGRQWGCPDQYEAFELGRGLYSFQFHQEEEKTKVLTGGPWLVDGGLLLVEEVKLNVPIEKTIFAFTKLWVRIHDLPPKGFTEMIGRAVGSALGTFDEADIPRSGAAGNPFNLLRQPNVRKHLRIKIKLNILKPLKRRQVLNLKSEDGTIETYDMRLSYEHLPDLCFCCGIIGHTFSSCSKYTDGNPLPYGEWIRADKFYRLTNAINQGKRPSASTSASKQPTISCSNNNKPAQVAVSPTKVHNNPTLSKSAPLEATRIPVVSMETSNPTIPTTSIPPNQPTNYTLPVNQYNFAESQINKSLAFPNPNFNPYNIQYLPNHNAWYSPFHSSPLPNLNPTFSPIPSKNLFSNSDIVLPQFSPFPESCEKDPGNNPIPPAMTGPPIPAFMGDTATKDNTSTMVDMDFGVVKNTVGQKRKFKAGASKRSNYNNKSNSTSPKKKGKAALHETEISVGSKGKLASGFTTSLTQ